MSGWPSVSLTISVALCWASSRTVAQSEITDAESATTETPYSNVTLQLPRPPNSHVMVCGSLSQAINVRDPVRITSPARHVMPRAPSVSASHNNELTGEPFTAAPAPVPNSSPTGSPGRRTSIVMPTRARSTSSGSFGSVPTTNTPHEALSAIVSTTLMSQLSMRESTISKHGTT